jgi:hypothetical protein
MPFDLEEQVRETTSHVSLTVGPHLWDVYVFGVTRVHRDWFVELAAVGPRSCTATVRVTSSGDRVMVAKRVLDLVRGWLLETDGVDHVFLEEPLATPAAC